MKKTSVKSNLNIFNLLKSTILSIFTTLVSILIFAFILNIFNLGNESIDIVNQIIKIVSIVLGCLFLTKGSKKNNIYEYLLLPLLYTIFTFLIFSALNKSFSLDITLFNDAFFGAVIGSLYYLLLARK